MLTVKHITPSGEEFLYPTDQVNFVPARAKGMPASGADDPAAPADSVWIEWPGTTRFEIAGGTVFVMNGNGSTVSRYDLGAWNAPV